MSSRALVIALVAVLAACARPPPPSPRPTIASAERCAAPREPAPASGPMLVRLSGEPDAVRSVSDIEGMFPEYESGLVVDGRAEMTAYGTRAAMIEASRRGVCVAVIMDEERLARHWEVVRSQIRD